LQPGCWLITEETRVLRTRISTHRLLTITDFVQHLHDGHDFDACGFFGSSALLDLKDAHDRLHKAASLPIHQHREVKRG
jgi:hypothetical protein